MKTVIFLCHGNICRSAAAEFVFKKLVKEEGRENEFHIYSRGVSNEEYGNDIYPPMKRALDRAGIPYERHFAQRITAEEYAEADYIFYMDRSNLDLALWRIPDTKHIYKSIFEYTPSVHEVADPWYDGRHEEALSQIIKCCKDILKHI